MLLVNYGFYGLLLGIIVGFLFVWCVNYLPQDKLIDLEDGRAE
jgi:hypothetical protein